MLRILVTPPLAPFSAINDPSLEGTTLSVESYDQWPSSAASERRTAHESVERPRPARTAIAKLRWKLKSTASTPTCPTPPSFVMTPTRLFGGCPRPSTYRTSSKMCQHAE